jgi:hypothetical protein
VILLISSLFVSSACTKILLIPSYKSTDFDVHRHWKAVTRNLPLPEWYFDDQHVRTFHTLDYPPGFAWFEYMWSNHVVTAFLISNGLLDERYLSLLPDTDNDVSIQCVTFMRSTVILSDTILWLGAGAIAWAATVGRLVSQLLKRVESTIAVSEAFSFFSISLAHVVSAPLLKIWSVAFVCIHSNPV